MTKRQDDHDYIGIELDEKAITVLAHPLRSRLLSQLRTAGPATATELADLLHTNTGATSYHLRKLEAVGLVSDTGDGVGKRRIWRSATDYHRWTTSRLRQTEDAATAMNWLERDYVRQFADKAERWLDVADEWPADWADALGLNDTFVTVTAEQLAELQSRLDALLDEFRHRGDHDPAARRIAIYSYARPVDPTPPSGPEGSTADAS